MDTKREAEFIGCGTTMKFIFEKIELAADRGYGVIIEPVGGENNRAFNLYQVTPSLAKVSPNMYEALKEISPRIVDPGTLNIVSEALAKAEGK